MFRQFFPIIGCLLTLHYNLAHALLTNVTIFDPPQNYTVPRTLYARTLLLNQNCETDNVLLATWENYGPNNNTFPYFPIYESLDLGATWTERSRVHDQVNGWGLRYQPFLYELCRTDWEIRCWDDIVIGK